MPNDIEDVLDARLDLRINSNELGIFKRKTRRTLGKPYPLFLREMITAFNEGNLRIVKPSEERSDLYVD